MSKILVEWRTHYGWSPVLTPYAADVERTWVVNEIGTASITFPMTTPNLWAITRWGRIFRILEDDIQPWVGVAEEMEWSESGVTLSLKGAEWLLQKKITSQGLAFPAATPAGTIAYGIFRQAYLGNALWHPIQPGMFDAPTPRFVEPYSYADCWEELKKLADESAAYVWIDADLKAHFRAQRGADKSAVIKLREGKHLVNVRIRESIADALTGAVALGAGDSIPSKTKITTSYNGDLGYERIEPLNFDNVTDPSELLRLTRAEIAKRVYPRLTVDCELVKANAGEFWGQFWLGDTVELVLTSYISDGDGLRRQARVLGVEISGEDRMRLALETINPFARPDAIPLIGWTPAG